MATFSFEVPDWVVPATHTTPATFVPALRLAAAMFWYGRGEISQGTAAAVAGLDRAAFLLAISKQKQDVIVVDFDDLDAELNRVAAERERSADG
jgi:hypothetical protein